MNKVILYLPTLPHLTLALDYWLKSETFASFQKRAIKFPDFNNRAPDYNFDSTCLDLSKLIEPPPILTKSLKGLIRELILFVGRVRSKQIKTIREVVLLELSKIKPEYIALTSDQCLFAYLLIGTDFENKLIFVQPALITPRKRKISHFVIFGLSKLLNRIDGIRSRPEELNWGRTSKKGLAILWSHLENNAYIKSKTIVGGTSIMLPAPQVDETSLERVLIVAPRISVESNTFRKKYFSDISILCNTFSNFQFLYRPHPSDTRQLTFPDAHNLIIQRSSAQLQIIPKIVISGNSALAIQIRRSIKNLLIFDYGRFARLGNLYFGTSYFEHGENLMDLVDFVARSYSQLLYGGKDSGVTPNDFCEIFEPDVDFREFEISLSEARG